MLLYGMTFWVCPYHSEFASGQLPRTPISAPEVGGEKRDLLRGYLSLDLLDRHRLLE